MTLREAWTGAVSVEDYEAHMARIGQAEANAGLLRDLLEGAELPSGSRVLIAGAGTGQMFEFRADGFLAGFDVTCSDINPAFLEKLRSRFGCATVVDDIENSALEPGWSAIAEILVLEHVDWRKAIGSLAGLRPENLILIIQKNPANVAAAVTPGRLPPGTMRVFAEEAPPHLIPEDELLQELAAHGLRLVRRQTREVQDGKSMIGLHVRPQPR